MRITAEAEIYIDMDEMLMMASEEEKKELRHLLFSENDEKPVMGQLEQMSTEEVREVYEYIVTSYHFDVFMKMGWVAA